MQAEQEFVVTELSPTAGSPGNLSIVTIYGVRNDCSANPHGTANRKKLRPAPTLPGSGRLLMVAKPLESNVTVAISTHGSAKPRSVDASMPIMAPAAPPESVALILAGNSAVAGISELPVDGCSSVVAFACPGGGLGDHCFNIRDSAVQALTLHGAKFDLRNVKPTAMFGSIMDFQSICQSPGLSWREGGVE